MVDGGWRTEEPAFHQADAFRPLPLPEAPAPSNGAGGAGPFLFPQTAGLLTDVLPLGLAALEQTLRALTEPEADVAVRDFALLNWLGLSCWLLGAAFTWAVARRARALSGALGESDLLPEKPS